MDAATIISLILSAASLVVALYVGVKQYTTQKNANNLPATWELLAQWQKPELIEAFDFIMNDLGTHDPEEGLAGLSSGDRAKVLNVAYFLQHVAMLIALDIIDEQVFTAFLRARTVAAWDKAGPFILKERVLNQASGPEFMSLFEAFAAKARLFPPEVGQQIIAKWLAKDRRGRIGPNIAERAVGRKWAWERAYSEAMGRTLISEPGAESPKDHVESPNDGANAPRE
jgi:hypothetical protein